MKRCCICNFPIRGFGNDPWPIVVDENAVCCDVCNNKKVIPARMARLEERDRYEHPRN